MDYESLRDKIRHYLLQQSTLYKRSLLNQEVDASVSHIARELQGKCLIGQRRLQKYLAEKINPKELSITIEDLIDFAQISGQDITSFIAYLFNQTNQTSLKPWESQVLGFFRGLHLALRRDLNCTVFKELTPDSSDILELLIKLQALNKAQLGTIQTVTDAFFSQNKLARDEQ